MNEEQLKKLVAFYQQKLADSTLEVAQLTVANGIIAEENASLQQRLHEAEAPSESSPPDQD